MMRCSKKGILHEIQNYKPKAESEDPTPKKDWVSKESLDWLDNFLKDLKPTFPMRAYYRGKWYILHEEGGEWEENEPVEE